MFYFSITKAMWNIFKIMNSEKSRTNIRNFFNEIFKNMYHINNA